MSEQLTIKAGERVLFAGKTGSGKTWLAERLLSSAPRLVVLDAKANLSSWNLREPNDLDWHKFSRGKTGRFRILPPLTDKPEAWYEELFERLYRIGDLTLYIDEAYAVAQSARPGKWLTALYTRGRELGIGVWAATQRPTWIPLFMLSESDWFLIFRLNVERDRWRLSTIAGDEVGQLPPDEHGFWLYNTRQNQATYFKQANESKETA